MQRRLTAAGLAVTILVLSGASIEAQRYPLAPTVGEGEHLHPFFEGWYPNPDGSHSLSFGYFDRNTGDDGMYIPLGPDNYVEPAEYDGDQPTWFPLRRERGVFTVTVPPDWPADRPVYWTLRNSGGTYTVPATWSSPAYELGHNPMASGTYPPVLRFEPEGNEGTGIVEPAWAEPRTARVGEPLELTVWGRDRMEPNSRDSTDVTLNWFRHRGPGTVVFEAVRPEEPEEAEPAGRAGGRAGGRGGGPPPPNQIDITTESDGFATVLATFAEPGEYVLRAVLEAFNANDSSSGNQCCWTNGFVEVSVSP